MHFPLGVFLFSPFFRWIGKRKWVWRPRKRLRAFHEPVQKRECTFPRLLQPGRGWTEPTQPRGGWERWRDLLWLQKGHVCEWQMSLPEGGCVHVLWVCIGPFLKSLVVSFFFFFFFPPLSANLPFIWKNWNVILMFMKCFMKCDMLMES